MSFSVPFLDLKATYLELKTELDNTYVNVMQSGHELEASEQEFANMATYLF